jgi:hypothetical protein
MDGMLSTMASNLVADRMKHTPGASMAGANDISGSRGFGTCRSSRNWLPRARTVRTRKRKSQSMHEMSRLSSYKDVTRPRNEVSSKQYQLGEAYRKKVEIMKSASLCVGRLGRI